MGGVLKADFKRVLKDKLLLIMGIIALVLAAITPLSYVALFSGMESTESEMLEQLVGLSAKEQFFSSFSIGNNMGLIAPIFLAIVLCKDFSFGTVRNKIISGKSRTQIYMSLFTTCATVLIGVLLLHAFATLGIALIFFDYQAAPFTMADFGYFLASLGLSILMLLWVAALLSWLCASMKNVGLVIVLYFAFTFILALVGSIMQMVIPIVEAVGSERTLSILRTIDRLNVTSNAYYIGRSSYTLRDILYLTLPALAGILGFTGLGLLKFNKKDLK